MENGRQERVRHSLAHVMAEAVLSLFPEAKLGIGPAIDTGFYYDFDLPRPLTPEDLQEVERRMRRILEEGRRFQRRELSRAEAEQLFADQPYKLELIADLPEDEPISTYTQGGFVDLCRGPHVESTSDIDPRAFKLLSIAGAYWHGDERRPMLQRIYGTAWETEEELEAYLKRLEEIERRDHRRLGRELDIFSIDPDIGAGLVLWHPNGAIIRHQIERFWVDEHLKRGYQLVYTPHIASERIYQISGHLETYADSMYAPMEIEGQPYRVKPMNCPAHVRIFQSRTRSYRDLPIRYAELGTVYRFERSGTLHGMLRVRGFTQDDSHIFCRPDQLEAEVHGVLDLTFYMMDTFGYTYKAYLATRPEKSIGSDEQWEFATQALRQVLEDRGMDYEVDEGGGVFYAPKIDIKLWDAVGREWQGPTCQVDLNEPERFDITYVGDDGREHRVVMVHRTVLGSMERFVGGLIEHYAGAFPVWLAPTQVVVIPIADRHVDYAGDVTQSLRAAGLRARLDDSPERMNAKIRRAQLERVPYMLVVGDREAEAGAVAVRLRSGEDLGAMPLTDFQEMVLEADRKRVRV
ncbi:MAG: threonine--tRNA ligase [Anaerolineae bacterium]|nr:threonine--tRNA ligase [Anaerolineae bacterium]